MARLFDDATSEYLHADVNVVSDFPVTLAGWFDSSRVDANQTILSLDDSSKSDGFQRENKFLRLFGSFLSVSTIYDS